MTRLPPRDGASKNMLYKFADIMIAAAAEGRACTPAAAEGRAFTPAAAEGRGSLTDRGFTTVDPAVPGKITFGHLTDRGFTTVDPAQGGRITFGHPSRGGE